MQKLLFLLLPLSFFSQPFTKKYLLSFHSCSTNCTPLYHRTHIAESNDGLNWTMVPNLPALLGSVPDILIRGDKLYLYNPSQLTRYSNTTSSWDVSPSWVSVVDTNGNAVNFVDPSAILDSSGNIVLFFLNSTGLTGDPATCSSYPCTKYFDSATEVPGSDGTQFILNPGHRYVAPITSGTASDPDIYFDGTKYVMYYSSGTATKAFSSPALHGSFTAFSGLANAELTNQGGIPCGFYDTTASQYWTYIHANGSGGMTEIRRIVHNGFTSAVNNFTTVITGTSIGLTAADKCESPGFCVNDFLPVGLDVQSTRIAVTVFPNPAEAFVSIESQLKIRDIELTDLSGVKADCVFQTTASGVIISTESLKGMYFIKIITERGTVMRKLMIE